MKSRSILILCVFATAALQSQTNFDLGKFRFRYQSYKGLDVGTSINQQGSVTDQTIGSRSSNQLKLDGNLNYLSFFNNDKIQNTTRVGFNINPSLQSEYNQRIAGIISHLSFSMVHRNYNSRNSYYGCEISLSDQLVSNKKSNLIPIKKLLNETTQINNNGEAMLTIGKGRAEYISDAVIALRFFEELKTKQLLLREATSDDITGFSNVIIANKNKRILDSRINRIGMIEEMVSFLKTNHLINECNAETFAILNDQVYFTSNTMRFSGKVNQLGAGVRVSNQAWKLQTDSSRNESFNNELIPQLVYSFTSYHPVNVKRQINKGVEFGIDNLLSNHGFYSNGSILRTRTPQILLSAFYERGYYPDTRTYITWTNRISSETGRMSSTGLVQRISTINNASTGINLYYYFSQKLRLSLNETLSYMYTGDFYKNNPSYKTSKLNNYFYAGFTYALY